MTQTILVTGASGFVGAHVVRTFLEAGYNVKSVVRSQRSADQVKKSHENYTDKLSFALVTDIAAPGATDEAVKGVDGVIHVASPFILDAKDFEKQLYTPAYQGTVNVLQSVKKNAPQVKRIVITSSFAAVLDPLAGKRPGYTYTESDWNPMTKENSENAVTAYLLSKKLAEKAAFDFVETEKPNFSVTTLDPPMVYGPIIHQVHSLGSLNTSSADLYRLFNGTLKEVPETEFYAYIDVRDLAQAHLLGYEKPEAANQRYIVTHGGYVYEQFVGCIEKNFPSLKGSTPSGGNVDVQLPTDVYRVDNSKSKNELGLKYRSTEETIVDGVNSILELQKILA